MCIYVCVDHSAMMDNDMDDVSDYVNDDVLKYFYHTLHLYNPYISYDMFSPISMLHDMI